MRFSLLLLIYILYSQEIQYYPFAVKLDKRVGSCNTLHDLSEEVCVPNKSEDLNIHIFHMIAGTNELEILTKDISYECKCKFDGKKFNSNQKWKTINPNVSVKKQHICEKEYIWNAATFSWTNGKYLASIIDDSVITCDEIIEETKTTVTNFNEKSDL